MGMSNKFPSFRPFGAKLELVEEFEIRINNQVILIPKGFRFDGASIPNLVWGLINLKPTDAQVLIPALAHDFFYTYHIFSREKSDKLFRDLLVQNGVNKWKVETMYRAVRMFGWRSWK
jgi:hypothetical protein